MGPCGRSTSYYFTLPHKALERQGMQQHSGQTYSSFLPATRQLSTVDLLTWHHVMGTIWSDMRASARPLAYLSPRKNGFVFHSHSLVVLTLPLL